MLLIQRYQLLLHCIEGTRSKCSRLGGGGADATVIAGPQLEFSMFGLEGLLMRDTLEFRWIHLMAQLVIVIKGTANLPSPPTVVGLCSEEQQILMNKEQCSWKTRGEQYNYEEQRH
jgi:hypothetical protein